MVGTSPTRLPSRRGPASTSCSSALERTILMPNRPPGNWRSGGREGNPVPVPASEIPDGSCLRGTRFECDARNFVGPRLLANGSRPATEYREGPWAPSLPIGTGEGGESVQFAAENLVEMVMGPNYHQ